MSLSLFERDPKATLLLMAATVTVTLGFMNLILTVIVDQATEAKARDVQQVALEKNEKKAEARDALLKLCKRIDKSGSGTLTIDELLNAYERSAEFHSVMTVMDMTQVELKAVFEFADHKGTGQIDYATFCDELFQMKMCNNQMVISMMRLSLQTSTAKINMMSPQVEALTKETHMCLAQLGTLSNKIDQLMVHAGEPLAQASKDDCAQPAGIAHHLDAYDPLDKSGGDTGIETPKDSDSSETLPMHNTCIDVLDAQTGRGQARKKLDQLQQDVQMMMDMDSYFLHKSMAQVDASLPRVTRAIEALMSSEGTANEHDVETLEVWFAEKKYQQCKATLDTLSKVKKAKPTEAELKEAQDMLESQDEQIVASIHRRIFSKLVDLLPLLVRREACADSYDSAKRNSYL